MKRILLVALTCLVLIGCSKDEDERTMEVTNLTGIDLYDADINFLKGKEGSTHRAPESLGLFENGTTKKISYDNETRYFSIFAKNEDGELAYTNRILISGYSVTIRPDDMLGDH